jgi:hypothetical protein
VIIAGQAWRGTTSHFNVATPFDATLFAIMGSAIALQTTVAIAVAVALWRQGFDDRAIGWALRLGMTITIAGAFSGGLMTRPTAAQLEQARAGERLTVVGAHTVGAPDGGPGLPGTGWSAEHGDLCLPHFLGLHALQSLALLAVLLRRSRWANRVRERLVIVGGSSYALLFALLLWQALRGQSILRPDAAALGALLIWATATAGAAWMAAVRPRLTGAHAIAS